MESALNLIENYGYVVIFVVVLFDFLGAPITSIPLLILAGALAAAGRMSPILVVTIAAAAAAAGDIIWYGIGKARGQTVFGLMCRMSRDRQKCVKHSSDVVTRFGVASLLIAKFVPGIGMIAPPAAGAVSMPILKFLAFDGASSLLWAAGFASAGYLYGERAHELLRSFQSGSRYGLWLATAVILILMGVIVRKIRGWATRINPAA
ncbi:MAG: DedA family protein [Acidobacteria bacterium]|nr:DedA family protein [Acidobacteriota bacterium]